MKKFTVAVSLLLVALGLVLMAFRRAAPEVQTPHDTVVSDYRRHLNQLAMSIDQLHTAAHRTRANEVWTIDLQAALKATRIHYKRVEFLVAHLDPQATKDHLNGAPLLALERHAPSLSILEPEGLQVLDELIFSDDPFSEREVIQQHCKTLKSRFKAIHAFQNATYIADRNILEAIRFELVRIATLGLSGFDTPASAHALPEAQAAFATVHQATRAYYNWLPEDQKKLRQELEHRFEAGEIYLSYHQDLDTFDRLEFTRTFLHPLYGLVLDLHLATGIETIDEVSNAQQPLNYRNRAWFDAQFFTPYYFAKLSRKDDREGVRALGKLLFFDPVLSKNLQRSCASCHNPQKGFTDGLAKSLAMDKKGTVDRNAPTILNAVFAKRFFHDLRSEELENQAEQVILNDQEFDMTVGKVIDRLQQSEEYQARFRKAFPQVKQAITRFTLMAALESYVLSLNSFNSPFDQYLRGETERIAPEIRQGFNVFMGKAACGTCHFPPTFAGLVPPDFEDTESEVLGVPAQADTSNLELDADLGRYANGRPKDHAHFYKNSFKTPTLRNIGLTAPYMHNGAYPDLQSVVDFYNRGGGAGMGLNIPNQTLPEDRLGLTPAEQSALVSFMESLTDTTGMTRVPAQLPVFENHPDWNNRPIGGSY
ncbi:MAG: cytochrome-c peroxidase [Salibacteraceae bacterium]